MNRIWVALCAFALVCFGGAAQADCGVAGTAQSVAIGQTGRSMLIHLPRGFDPAKPAPLVFLLHGSGGTGAAMLKDSKLAEAADRHGFMVAAPNAGIPHDKGFVWNIPGVPTVAGNIPGPNDPDDVAYIIAAIDWLAGQRCADRSRVYVTGLSAAGV